MATTHVYTITSSTYVPGSASDPVVSLVGDVDGLQMTVTCWLSAYQAAQAQGVPALKNLAVSLMLPVWQAANPSPPQPPVGLLTGTFTQ